MQRIAFAVFTVLLLAFGLAGAASATGHNCGDYVSQAAAQSALVANPSDPDNLDGSPENGMACDSYDYANNPGTNPGVVSGGDDSGADDGTDDTGSDADDSGSADDSAGGPDTNGDDPDAVTGLPETGVGDVSTATGATMALFSVVSVLALIVAATMRRTGSIRN